MRLARVLTLRQHGTRSPELHAVDSGSWTDHFDRSGQVTRSRGKVVARNIGRWVWNEGGLVSGSGHQDFTGLICPLLTRLR